MLFEFVDFANARLAAALAGFRLPSGIFWLYFSGSLLLVAGLVKILKDELPQTHGLDKIMPFGRLFLAIPLAVFGTEHFTNTADIANIVPRWIPAQAFWVSFVGVALIAAALSITVQIQSPLAATLLGAMFFFIRTLDRHTRPPGTPQQSAFLDPHAAGDCLQRRRFCLCGISWEERAHKRRARACNRRTIFRRHTRSVLWRRTFSASRVCSRSSAARNHPGVGSRTRAVGLSSGHGAGRRRGSPHRQQESAAGGQPVWA